jgi:protein-S-isoprenylcysteine O-methyltransferase Ste14
MMVRGMGVGLVMVGLILMGLAVTEMRMKKTTVLPHLQASHLVRTGIFARTRNPIYLGDVFVLVGCILWWGGVGRTAVGCGFSLYSDPAFHKA